MKNKIKLILIASMLITNFLNAQSTWWHTSGQLRTGIPSGGFNGASANTGLLRFYHASSTQTVDIQPGNTTTSYALTLPTAAPTTNGSVLASTTGGVLSWTGGPWSLTGNASTTASTAAIGTTVNNNFIGTTGATDWVMATNNLERMRISSAGSVGIGTITPGSTTSLTVAKPMIDDGAIGVLSSGVFAPTAASFSASYFRTNASISGSNAVSFLWHFRAVQGTITPTLTNQYGFAVDNTLTGATNNYGFWGNIATGTNRWNVFIAGTAPNFFAGDIGVGTNAPAARLHVWTGTASVTANGNANDLVIESNEANGLTFLTATNDASSIRFGDSGNNSIGSITYNHVSDHMAFASNAAERVRITSAGDVGIGTTSPARPLHVVGQVRTDNDSPEKPTAGGWSGISDQRLKNNIASFNDGLSVLRQVKPKTYQFNGIGGLPTNETYIGVIAQELQPVAPYCVRVGKGKLTVKQSEAQNFSGAEIVETLPADSVGEVYSIISPLTYNYDGLIYVMINSIKQLDSANTELLKKDSIKDTELQAMQTINSLYDTKFKQMEDKIAKLDSVINSCCSLGSTRSMFQNTDYSIANSRDVELSNRNIVILDQNVPNPFAEQTTINYYLPDYAMKAQIIFLEQSGKLIKAVDLTEKGKGTLNVFANDLTSGVYSYSLIVDGQTIETKKMVKTK